MTQDRDNSSTQTATSCLGPEEWAGHLALVAGHPDRMGGMETFCRFLAETAASAGWGVTVALSGENIYDHLQAAYPHQIDVDNVNWIDRTCAGDREYRWTRINARRRWFRRVRPDVAVVVQSSNTPFRCTIAGATLAGVPVISTHRTMAFPVEDVPSRRHFFGLLPGIGLHRRRVVFKTWLTALLASRVVFNSEAVRSEYERLYHYPRGRGLVISNAVVVDDPPARGRAGSPKTSSPDHEVTIGFAGRIGSDKRLDVLLRAVAATNCRSRLRVLLYGAGDDRPALAALATDLGIADRVEWRGLTQNPARAYANMDMVVLCSPRESSSNMVLEAMAAGKAVVTTNVGGMPELVGGAQSASGFNRHSEACGICVSALNVRALTAALDYLVANDAFRVQLGERARAKALREHAPEVIGSAWLSLLSEVAGRRALKNTDAPGSQSPALMGASIATAPRGLKPAAL